MGSQERKNDQRVIRQFASSLFGNIVCMKDQKYMIMNTKEYPILRRAPRSDSTDWISVEREGGRVRNQKGWRGH